MLRQALTMVAHSRALRGFIELLDRFDDRRCNLLRVLTYHRVDERQAHPDLDPGLVSATPSEFEQQIGYISRHSRAVSMQEVLCAARGGTRLPPRSVLVTFDDAYNDFARYAWPVLKHHGVPVTLFVPTAFPDQPGRVFWWDRLHQALRGAKVRRPIDTPVGPLRLATARDRRLALARLKDRVRAMPHGDAMGFVDRIIERLGSPTARNHVLKWHELHRLTAEGVTLGMHSQTHPFMNRIAVERARAEVIGARCDLVRHVGPVLPVFAYPGGACDAPCVRVLHDAGIELAFTTARGINNLDRADRLRLRRINVGANSTPPVLRAQLLPWVEHLNRWT